MGRIAKTFLLATAIAVTGATPALADPGGLKARSHGKTVNATRGSFCWTETEMGFCSDSAYPLKIRGRLAVSGRDRVKIRTEKPASRVDVQLLRVKGQDIQTIGSYRRAKPFGTGGTEWRVRLPRRLRGATVLDAFVRYPQGDGSFWAGLKQR